VIIAVAQQVVHEPRGRVEGRQANLIYENNTKQKHRSCCTDKQISKVDLCQDVTVREPSVALDILSRLCRSVYKKNLRQAVSQKEFAPDVNGIVAIVHKQE
jgi:hypothetical protein